MFIERLELKKVKLCLFITLSIIITSCKSDDDNSVINSDITRNLVSITKDYYNNNTPTGTEVYNFYYDKLINIQYSDGSYDDIYYERDLITRILEFDAFNNLEWTITYSYNSSKELIRKQVIPSANNTDNDVSRQKDIVYADLLIQTENSWSDGGFHSNNITLNDQNQMIDDKLFNAQNELVTQSLFEYENDNLKKITTTDAENNVTNEATFNYLNKTTSKEYRYHQYLFGSEWKNNSSLNKQFGLSHYDSYEISENYISDYFIYNFVTDISASRTFSYEFDDMNYIIKHTENISWSYGEEYRIVTTYQYE